MLKGVICEVIKWNYCGDGIFEEWGECVYFKTEHLQKYNLTS